MAEIKKIDQANTNKEMPNQEMPKEDPKTDAVEKKPNVFKRIGAKIGSGFRAVRESPVATAIGAALGAAVTFGAGVYLDYRRRKYSDEIPVSELLPEANELEEMPDEPAEEVAEE